MDKFQLVIFTGLLTLLVQNVGFFVCMFVFFPDVAITVAWSNKKLAE